MNSTKRCKLDYAATCFKNGIQPIMTTQDGIDYYFGEDIANGTIEGTSVSPEMLGLEGVNEHYVITGMQDTELGPILYIEDQNGNQYALSSIDIADELDEIRSYDRAQIETLGFELGEDGELTRDITD